MSKPVSLLVWQDARTDPRVFGDAMREVFVRRRGLPNPEVDVYTTIWLAKDVARDRGNVVLWWAEVPVVSDLTDENVREAVDALQAVKASVSATRGYPTAQGLLLPKLTNALARLRAALGGEKEQA